MKLLAAFEHPPSGRLTDPVVAALARLKAPDERGLPGSPPTTSGH